MKLSVAIATYNGASYIEEQLTSILQQSRKVDEVVICDDRSSDDTVDVVNKFIKKHNLAPNWKIEINEKNLGYASNFMCAAKKTTGDLIFFCDQDDIWLPGRIKDMEQVMINNPKILMMGSEFEPFASTEDAPSVPEWELKQFRNDKSIVKFEWNSSNIFIGCQGCTMCIRRDFFNEILPYWFSGWAHDEYVWKLALCKDGLYMYHAPTLRRRLHSSNVTLHKMRDVTKRVKFLEELLKGHEMTLKYAKDLNLEPKKQKLLERNIVATKMRIKLLKDKKYFNTIKLALLYRDCYHKARAIPVELMMAIRN